MMKGRRILRAVGRLIAGGVRRDVERTERSYRYHVRQVFGRPIRTLFSVVFATLLVAVMYTVAFDSTAALGAVEAAGEDPVALAAAVWVVGLVFLAMLVVVPVSLVLGGVSYEREHGFIRTAVPIYRSDRVRSMRKGRTAVRIR